MIMQKGSEEKFHLVYAISWRNNEYVQFYDSWKLELLVIVWAVASLRIFLMKIKSKIVTVYQALCYLHSKNTEDWQEIR